MSIISATSLTNTKEVSYDNFLSIPKKYSTIWNSFLENIHDFFSFFYTPVNFLNYYNNTANFLYKDSFLFYSNLDFQLYDR